MATPNPDIIYRSGSAGPLTFAQLDGNFALLSQSIADITTPESASYAATASYAVSASYAPSSNPFPFTGDAEFSGSILVSGSIIPNTDGVSQTSSFSLGSPTAAWKDIYVSNGTINFLDGAGNIQSTLGTGNNQLEGDTFINGRLSQGYNTTASGAYSHAEGINTLSSNSSSHAEGLNTTASGDTSHAEGSGTKAIGAVSHAEGGGTVAYGGWSHAEGYQTVASGARSHAEGSNTLAIGAVSHTEGYLTTASGDGSHAEGLGTIAVADYQHVAGRYNITSSNPDDLFIIGNGTSNNTRKSALVVKMSGSLILPTTQSAAPSWTGVDGEIVPATVGGQHFLYMWMAGAWRSGSFA